MTISFAPFQNKVLRRMNLAPKFVDVASDTIIVSPQELVQHTTPAIFLGGQLNRVKAAQRETSLNAEMKRIEGKAVHHVSTVAYRIENAVYLGGVLYKDNARFSQTFDKEKLVSFDRLDLIEECSLPSSWVASKYFGHFLVDDMTSVILAKRFSEPRLGPSSARNNWRHAKDCMRLFAPDIETVNSAKISSAWIFQDYGMTKDRRGRLNVVRQRFRTMKGMKSGKRVFIRRGTSGKHRFLSNEAEIEKVLIKEGFDIIDPEQDSFESIRTKVANAELVCGVESSALAYGFLGCAPKGAMLIIQPPYRFNNLWKDFADAVGLRYGFVVGIGETDSFEVSPSDILRTIDLLS